MIELSVSKTKWSSLLARNRALILYIQIEIKRIRAWVLASKLLHFVSLTDRFIVLDAKLLKPRS